MGEEAEHDSTIGTDEFPAPYGFAHMLHRTFIYAAGERLASLSWCVNADPYPHVMSVSELARAAAEAASTAVWLSEEEAAGEPRLKRMLGLLAASQKEESGLRHELGLEDKESGTDLGLKWGNSRGMVFERPGSRVEMLRRSRPATGSTDYRRLSAVAHSTVYAVMGSWLDVVEAQAGDLQPIRVHAVMAATAAVRYVILGARSVARTAGGGTERVDRLEQEAAELEGAAVAAGGG